MTPAEALREAMHQAVAYDGLDLSTIGPQHWYSIAKTVLADWEAWPIRGVRVDGDTVVVSVKGGNQAARWLCGAIIDAHIPQKKKGRTNGA